MNKQKVDYPLILLIVALVFSVMGGLYRVQQEMRSQQEVMRLKGALESQRESTNSLLKEINELEDRIEECRKARERLEEKLEEEKEKVRELTPSRSTGSTGSRGSESRQLLGTFTATAYTDNVQSQGKWVGQTATGRKPQVGVIAVDPRVIPLNTKLYVEGYGECVAGDTGGAIKGQKIDLFFNTQSECTKYGRKQVKVWRIN